MRAFVVFLILLLSAPLTLFAQGYYGSGPYQPPNPLANIQLRPSLDTAGQIFFKRYTLNFPAGQVSMGSNLTTWGVSAGTTWENKFWFAYTYQADAALIDTVTPTGAFLIGRTDFNNTNTAANVAANVGRPVNVTATFTHNLFEIAPTLPNIPYIRPYGILDFASLNVSARSQDTGSAITTDSEVHRRSFWGLGAACEWKQYWSTVRLRTAFGPKYSYFRGDWIATVSPNVNVGFGYELRAEDVDNFGFRDQGAFAQVRLVF